MDVLIPVLIPFLGTAAGAACVFFFKSSAAMHLQQRLQAFAAGVMTAACIWSLLLPALTQSEHLGALCFAPALLGIWCGVLAMGLAERLLPTAPTGNGLLFFAVTAHNLPEGMAVGVAVAGYLAGLPGCTLAGATALAVGIGVQNIPEGAIISLPLRSAGASRRKAFLWGTLSGAVEPLGAILAVALAGLFVPILPFLLSCSAGAMLYVVVQELLPSRQEQNALPFTAGFTLMMLLDVLLG